MVEVRDIDTFSPQIFCNTPPFTVLLAIVSSCPDGMFSCASGECLPAGLTCDFKMDYKNGTDEEFCGMITVQNTVFVKLYAF